jgi:REP element-mobilizing transposase RayT
MTDMIFRRRRLPHQDVDGHPIFITACLHGSLSSMGLSRIEKYREELEGRPKPDGMSIADWDYHKQKLLFAFTDKLLDCESPVRHLQDERQAEIVRDAFLHFADERYKLLAFVVMPSHHHWLFLPDEAWAIEAVQAAKRQSGKLKSPREIISHSIQSYTATMCNRVRGTTGIYWQHETFDHWARDEAEALRIIKYIEMNPVKAGLVDTPEAYRWSSAPIRQRLGISPGHPIPKLVA